MNKPVKLTLKNLSESCIDGLSFRNSIELADYIIVLTKDRILIWHRVCKLKLLKNQLSITFLI